MASQCLPGVSTRAVTASLLALVAVLPVQGQNAQSTKSSLPAAITDEGWLTPPADIANIVLAPRHLNVSLNNPSPNRKQFLRTVGDGLPSQLDFAKPHYWLGGVQIDPRANRARNMTTRGATRVELISPEDGKVVTITPPSGAKISSPAFSPDGSQVAYYVNTDNASHIYVADAATGKSRRLTQTPVLATLVSSIEWAGAKRIFAVQIPDGRGAEPAKPAMPEMLVRVATPEKNPNRTYHELSLLQTPHDMKLVDHYMTGQVVAIDVANGKVTKVGSPALIRSLDGSPDGNHVRVTYIVKPYSYLVPVTNFGTREELWSIDGKVKVLLSEQPLRDGTPADTANRANQNEKRNLSWRPDGQGLSYLQQDPAPRRNGQQAQGAAAGEQEGQPARRKDRVYQWLPPFDSANAKVIFESDTRISTVRYSEDAKILFVNEGGPTGGGFGGGAFGVGGGGAQGARSTPVHEYAVYLSDTSKKHTIARYRSDDFHTMPGQLLTKRSSSGIQAVQVSSDGKAVFLQGVKYDQNPEQNAPRPFLDKVEIETGNKTRVFESAADVYESIETVLDDDASRMIIQRESATMVPNDFLRESNGSTRKLTDNKDFAPEITNAPRRSIDVTRPDGMKFKVRVTLPPEFRQGSAPPPAMFWFYPREYDGQEAYDRTNRAYNKNAFSNLGPRSMTILTKLGYAVVEPDAPIFGETGRMNDNYVHDLRTNLATVIDELSQQGLIDRSRLGLGGHSYGAFSTVNAMVHTPFFKAGIAGDGNYNRTLTPASFQSERRQLWEARDVYLGMSPFLFANQLTGALLMYHGMDDQNVGTHPDNATRLFHALEGLGKTTSLYMYPFEDHGPATKETNLDMWARWISWLDTYVKNAKAEAKVTT